MCIFGQKESTFAYIDARKCKIKSYQWPPADAQEILITRVCKKISIDDELY